MTSYKYLAAFLLGVATIQVVHASQPSKDGSILPLPLVVPAVWPDALEVLSPSEVCVEGWRGNRVMLNDRNRQAPLDPPVEPGGPADRDGVGRASTECHSRR